MVTHIRIGTYIYAISKCAFLLGFRLDIKFKKTKKKVIKKSNNAGVATRSAQMVWPMMTVSVTNFEGFTRQQF